MPESSGRLSLGQAAAPATHITASLDGSVHGAPERVEQALASRIVIVLGREPELDVALFIKRARRENAELVILNFGLPLTQRQKRICDAALEAAGRGSIRLDELVIFEANQMAKVIRADDRIAIAASRRERRRIKAALRDVGRWGDDR